jgi:hypoxia up-regulated 1
MIESKLTGVAKAIANLTERGAIDPVVKATLLLSESGFVSVSEAVVFGEIKDESLTGKFIYSLLCWLIQSVCCTGKLKDFFGAAPSTAADGEAQSAENIPPRDTESSSSAPSSSASSTSSSAEASTSAKAKKKITLEDQTIKLEITNEFTTIPPMTVEQKKEARSRFVSLHLLALLLIAHDLLDSV